MLTKHFCEVLYYKTVYINNSKICDLRKKVLNRNLLIKVINN